MKQLSKLKITASILGLVLVIIMYTTITNFNKLMAAGGITILIIFVGEIIRLFEVVCGLNLSGLVMMSV